MAKRASMAKRAALWMIALLLCTTAVLVYASKPDGTIPLSIGEHKLYVELAQTQIERSRGLMFRNEMPENQGMLFVFEGDETRSFWMKNTFIPLSIAFIDSDKRIINMHDMAPNNSTKSYRSAGPARYALEVNVGWFAQRGIGPGDRVTFELLPEAEAK